MVKISLHGTVAKVALGSVLAAPLVALKVDSHLRSGLPSSVGLTLMQAPTPGARDILFVYAPGIVAKAKGSSEKHIDQWLTRGNVLLVDYKDELFRGEQVAREVAAYLHRYGAPYRRIVFIGSSMGGLVASDVFKQLDAATRSKTSIVAIDAPTSARDLQFPLNIGAPLMHALTFGPIWNQASQPILKAWMKPPKTKNIEPAVKAVDLAARFEEMTSFPLSVYQTQVDYIVHHGRLAPGSLSGLEQLVYVRSLRDTDTVRLKAYYAWWKAYGQEPAFIEVDSPHVGYAERPNAWYQAFEEIFSALDL